MGKVTAIPIRDNCRIGKPNLAEPVFCPGIRGAIRRGLAFAFELVQNAGMKILIAGFVLFSALPILRADPAAPSGGAARHVVVMVWDGMRPDFVTEKNAPALFQLAREGVTFRNHHPVYVSSTEVNGAAIATGDYPCDTGIIANREYR